ncbi:MAG: VTC domain-containing protein, partial [Chloroflexota bacterium]|nr:VTC domain-containing protein [Chloroflexota bacterium]
MDRSSVIEKQETPAVLANGAFPQRFERKFFVAPRNIGFAYSLLRQVCHLDKEYPHGQINSLYFDTPDLDQHTRSMSGEFKKDKVRIRWYGTKESLPENVPVFLELKSRQGFASSKQRERLLVPLEMLDPNRLNAGIIDRTTLGDTILRFGYFPEKPLKPIIEISYSRYRFTEMLTGMRVSLDYDVRSTLVSREFGFGERELPLRGGVIEVKGPSMELPSTLHRIKLLDTDWS